MSSPRRWLSPEKKVDESSQKIPSLVKKSIKKNVSIEKINATRKTPSPKKSPSPRKSPSLVKSSLAQSFSITPSPKKEDAYEIFMDQLLGQGATGTVVRGKRNSDGLDVVIKIIQKKDSSKDAIKKINRERYLIQQLPPNQYVLSTIDSIERDDDVLIVSEFLKNTISLQNYVKMQLAKHNDKIRTLKTEAAIVKLTAAHYKNMFQIFKKILLGIKHLHKHGIAHRDIKPQNIMININTLDPIIIDFDMSCFVDPKYNEINLKDLNCETGRVMGTPRYLSKEAWEGGKEMLSLFTSDLFALAATFYYMISFKEYGAQCYNIRQFQIFTSKLKSTDKNCRTNSPEANYIISMFIDAYTNINNGPVNSHYILENAISLIDDYITRG